MDRILDRPLPHNAIPLEREYEAWLIRAIEDYLDEIGVPHRIVCIGPSIERGWPADIAGVVSGVVFGLQVKRPAAGPEVQWPLDQPPGQFGAVKGLKDVYYALPRVRSRDQRRVVLHHTLFWRPAHSVGSTLPVSPDSLRHHELTKSWGELVTDVRASRVGQRLGPDLSLGDYLEGVTETLFGRAEIPFPSEQTDSRALWFVWLGTGF